MTLALNPFYDSSELLPMVRDLLARNVEAPPSDDEIARRLGVTVHAVIEALEALLVDGEVLS